MESQTSEMNKKDAVPVLVLGGIASGKTVLLRQLKHICSQLDDDPDTNSSMATKLKGQLSKRRGIGNPTQTNDSPEQALSEFSSPESAAVGIDLATTPTVGVELVHVEYGGKTFALQEVGSEMESTWHSYVKDGTIVVYMIDRTNRGEISRTCVTFMQLVRLCQLEMRRPVVVCLNKGDIAQALSMHELQSLMRLDDVKKTFPFEMAFIEMEASNGKGCIDLLNTLSTFSEIAEADPSWY